jgi:hypothetical protein
MRGVRIPSQHRAQRIEIREVSRAAVDPTKAAMSH